MKTPRAKQTIHQPGILPGEALPVFGRTSRSFIHRERRPGVDMTIVERGELKEFHLTLRPLPGEQPERLLARLEGQLREHDALIVKQVVYGSLRARDQFLAQMGRLFGLIFWPVTWIEGGAPEPNAIAGVQVFALSGAEIELVRLHGRIVGRIFENDLARHCLLGNICPTDPTADKSIQARQVFEELEIALVEHGMTLSNIVRSWMYLDDIQRWYGAFNQVRNEIFTQRNMFPAGLPATTDIGAKNPYSAGLAAAVWAVEPRSARFRIAEVKSPLQCAASGYGSCFSRAMELATPTLRHLLVSGTASIGPNGRLMRPRDLPGQIHLTMEVVKALLNSRGMGFDNVIRATAYFHNISDAPAFTAWCCEKRVTLPIIVTQADICREELLFEIELDAMTETQRRQPLVARKRVAQVALIPFGGSIE